MMAEVKSQFQSDNSFKMPTYVLTNQTMRQADAVKCAHVELKEQFVESEDQYVAALRKAAKHLIMQQDEVDQFIF